MTVETNHGFEPKKFIITRCWSCGKPLPEGGKCPDPECSGAPAIEAKPPKTVLPFCGQNEKFNLTAYGSPRFEIDLTRREEEVSMRACCKCGKQWMCDAHTWIYGICPNCGANGSDGKGDKSYDKILGIEPWTKKVSLETELSEHIPDKASHLQEHLVLTKELMKRIPDKEKDFKKIEKIVPPNKEFEKYWKGHLPDYSTISEQK